MPLGRCGTIIEPARARGGIATDHHFATHDDPTLGKADLLSDLRHLVPAGCTQCRSDELGADVPFGKKVLFHHNPRDQSNVLSVATALMAVQSGSIRNIVA